MNFMTLKITIFYGYTKPLQSDAKWRLIHSLYSFWQLLYTWLAWIRIIQCIVQCKVFEQATVEGRRRIPGNSFEILSLWNAMFIFLGELDLSCKLQFLGLLDWNLQTTTLCYSSFNQRRNCGDFVLKWGNFGKQNNPHPPPSPHHYKLGCCCVLQQAQTAAAQHCMEGLGMENFIFSFLSWQTVREAL